VESAELVQRFRAGDPDAVREVYRQHGGTVLAIAQRALGDRSLAEEAVQQTFLQAWRASASVDPNRDLGPWLYTIARRAAIDVWRRESRRAADSLDVDGADGSDPALVVLPPALDAAWDAWQVRQAVDSLGADERSIVRLQHFEGLTHAEIAERLDIPVGTVKSRSFRAHKRLAAALGHLAEVGS
jgi:RNA polymerase sigma-70 factor (ECF subfamily)